jgi:FAD:protein FMN transferase
MRLIVCAALLTACAGCPDKSATEPTQIASAHPSAEPSIAPSASTVAPTTPAEKVTREDGAMGTHLTFAAFTTNTIDKSTINKAFDAAIAEIKRIEALMTTWQPTSDLSKVNEAAGKRAVVVSKETFDIVSEAVHASDISEGTFDITFESLHGLWKFDQDLDPHPPSEADVKAKLPLVNYKHIKLDPKATSIMLDTVGCRISLGGIAKGYAVDRAVAVLDLAKIPSFYVQAGGDLFTRGKKPDGTEWQTGVHDPRGPEGSFFALLPTSDHAFSTAGDYERAYIANGKRYHHIIDPRTGFPATASRSVTIWAPTALLADELDDAVFILGPEKGLKLVESIDGVGAVIVDSKNTVWISERLKGKLLVRGTPTDGL